MSANLQSIRDFQNANFYQFSGRNNFFSKKSVQKEWKYFEIGERVREYLLASAESNIFDKRRANTIKDVN